MRLTLFRPRALAAGLLLTAWAYLASPLPAAPELTEEKFQQLHQELRPDTDEPWRSIPWQIDLLEARQLATEQQKPIFIWAMDGHPLGCT